MKIVGICASPRDGNSEFMLRTALESANESGAETEIILLRSIKIGFVGGGNSDEFDKILPKMLDADALIFASPCYYDMISPQLLNLICRLDHYSDSLKGKKAGGIISGKEEFKSSGKNAVKYLKRACDIYNMNFVGAVFGKADKAREISGNKKAVLQLKELGRKLAIV